MTVAGLWILPTSLAILVAGPLAGCLDRRYGQRGSPGDGDAPGGARLRRASPSATPSPGSRPLAFIFCGIGIGFAFAVDAEADRGLVRPTETGIATGMFTVVRTVGGVMGAQVGAVLLADNVAPGTRIPTEAGFVHAFWMGAVGALVAAIAALWARPRRARPQEEAETARDAVLELDTA